MFRQISKQWIVMIVAGILIVTSLAGCNTLRGAREDVVRGADGVANMLR